MSYTLETSYLLGEDSTSIISDYLAAVDPYGQRAGQTWTVSGGYNVGRISVKVGRVGSPGNITCDIYATSAGKPTGASLGTATVDGDTFDVSPTRSFQNFDFSPAVAVSDGTVYAFIFAVAGGDDSNYVELRRDGSSSIYSGGQLVNTLNEGSSWTLFPTEDCLFYLYSEDAAHAKASNPTPADTATGVDFSTPTLDWDGNGDTYDVRGGAAGNFVLLASGLADSTYTLTEQQKTFFKNGVVTWRVDSTKDGDTLTGDDWTFDPRPGQATNPTPTNAGSDISLEQQFSWDAVDYTDTYDVVISGSTVSSAQVGVTFDLDSDYYTWEEAVTWRVDSTNEYGTTTGTNWTFTATPLDYTRITWTSINGGSGPDDGGVEGVDFWYTGLNNVITVNRLVCMAKDTFYYESLGEV